MSIHWTIARQCLKRPRRRAIVDDRGPRKAIEILIGAFFVADEIEKRCRTDTVGLLLPTSSATPIAALAGWFTGKTVVPLNYLLKPEELQYVVDDCGTDTIVTVQPMLDFLDEPPRVGNLLKLEDVPFGKRVPTPRIPARAKDDDLALLLYTSGTSGRPKGVMLSHGNIEANIRQVKQWVGFTMRDKMLGVLPQFHSFGLTVLTLFPLAAGVEVVYTARFVPGKILGLIREHRPTIFVAIPSMYNALLHAKSATAEDFASLTYMVSGGEPLPDAVFEGFRDRFGVTINEGYGLTETAPVSNWCRPHEWRRGAVGKPLPEIDERIVDIETRDVLGANEDGEVLIAGPNVMQGYFRLEKETKAVFEGEYFRTGDIGRLDDDGQLYITGRLKEMLIVGGENVFPREIEEVLNANADVSASGVVGWADPVRGEVPVAFVELVEGATFDERALQAWCREHLAGYKVPRRIEVLEELPRNPTGKIMRRELAAMVSN